MIVCYASFFSNLVITSFSCLEGYVTFLQVDETCMANLSKSACRINCHFSSAKEHLNRAPRHDTETFRAI